VKSKRAEFDMASQAMYSEGEVEMRMGLKEGEPVSGKLLLIRSSGVRYDSKSGKVHTDRAAAFEFDRGKGKCEGAEYDPTLRELRMFRNVELLWTGSSPDTKPMLVQSGELLYKELEAKVYLSPWSKLKRDTLTMDAGNATVTLVDGAIDFVEAVNAKGVDAGAARRLDYSASNLAMQFDATGEVKSVRGQPDAKLLSATASGETEVQTKLLDLLFDPKKEGAQLQVATANGASRVETRPAAGSQNPSGTVDFLPNREGQRKRQLKGERIVMNYGPGNKLHTFRAVDVSTRTEGEKLPGKPQQPPSFTWSKDLLAEFDLSTGAMKKLEQWNDFRYEEGLRRATSDKAILDYPKDEITLEGKRSRVWDDTGSTTANRIVMEQAKDRVVATGEVASTRLPDKKPAGKPGTGVLASNETWQAKANRMISSNNNSLIRYEGNALLWQGADRIEADVIDIDRRAGKLMARGRVVSQFIETKKVPNQPDQQIFTMVRAPEMFYEDGPRLAIYYGGAALQRAGLDVAGRELRAYLKDVEGGTSLDRALADGEVKIVQKAPDRVRTGTSEHGEYYVADEKVILSQGKPVLVDTLRGVTRGKVLTYFSGNDKLIVDGTGSEIVRSRLKQR
jgi:lipopolysaccharide export system protein LptA